MFVGLPVSAILYFVFARSIDVEAETRIAEREAEGSSASRGSTSCPPPRRDRRVRRRARRSASGASRRWSCVDQALATIEARTPRSTRSRSSSPSEALATARDDRAGPATGRWPASRSRSRTTSGCAARRRRTARSRCATSSPTRTAPASRGCATPARSSSARPTTPSSATAGSPTTRSTGSPATRATSSRTPGGSSGGSARGGRGRHGAVRARDRRRRLDPDPASFCGIAGLKPTFGLVPKLPGFRGWPTPLGRRPARPHRARPGADAAGHGRRRARRRPHLARPAA